MTEPALVRFEDTATVYYADTCMPLRAAGDLGRIGLWAYGRETYPGKPIPPEVLPALRSVGVWEVNSPQDWGLQWHRNEGIEVTVVTSGRTHFSCDGVDYDQPAGTVTITRPWQLHRVGRPHIGPSTLSWFIIDVGVRRPNQEWTWPSWLPMSETDLLRLTQLLSHNERPVWRANRELLDAFGRLDRTLRGESSRPLSRIAICVTEVLIELAELLEQQDLVLDPRLSSTERTVDLFLQSLTSRLDEEWTVDKMARECGLGRTRFVHYCRQSVNVTPLELLQGLRMDYATHLLEENDHSVLDIALRCGYQSSQYFATVYRRHTGRTPKAVQRAAQEGAEATALRPARSAALR